MTILVNLRKPAKGANTRGKSPEILLSRINDLYPIDASQKLSRYHKFRKNGALKKLPFSSTFPR